MDSLQTIVGVNWNWSIHMPRKYSAEFKASIALEVIEHSRPITAVAKDNNVSEQSVSRWVQLYRKEHPELADQLNESERDELIRLRRQNARLKEEVEILGKATAFFVKKSQP